MMSSLFPLSYNAQFIITVIFIIATCFYCRAVKATWFEIFLGFLYGSIAGIALVIVASYAGL